jgi:flagellar protein FlaG
MIQDVKNISATQPIHRNEEEFKKLEPEVRVESLGPKALETLSQSDLEKIIKEMNQFIQIFNSRIAFELDKDTGKTILKIIDPQTNEVIRQIPPEELLRISKRISELLGLIINARV